MNVQTLRNPPADVGHPEHRQDRLKRRAAQGGTVTDIELLLADNDPYFDLATKARERLLG